MAIALGDVIVDALMVEKGQPLGLTGRFQSIQWAAANAALLLTGIRGGYVAKERVHLLSRCRRCGQWTDWQSRLLRGLTDGNLVADGTAQPPPTYRGEISCQPPLSI
jgi:hypothetical protein